MAKQNAEGVYKIAEVVEAGKTSREAARSKAIEAASKSLRDLRVAEVIKTGMKVENGNVTVHRTRVSLSPKYKSWARSGAPNDARASSQHCLS